MVEFIFGFILGIVSGLIAGIIFMRWAIDKYFNSLLDDGAMIVKVK